MKLPRSIQDVLDDLDLEKAEHTKLKDYLLGLDDLPEDPTAREAKKFVSAARKDLADSDSKIVRQKAPKKKEKEEEPKEEPKPKKKKEKEEKEVKIEEGRKLSFKAFLSEQA